MENKIVDYGFLAAEYYDATLHPTCANFREASKKALKKILSKYELKELGNALEVGAGMSLLLELLQEEDIRYQDVYITDKSQEMLAHSKLNNPLERIHFKNVAAENTVFESDMFNTIISSLGDPYNTTALWNEMKRMLKKGGYFIYTTPAFEWSNNFRKNTGSHDYAEFLTSNKEVVKVPSFIFESSEQIRLIEQSGLTVQEVFEITLADIESEAVSPKLTGSNTTANAIVTAYLVTQ